MLLDKFSKHGIIVGGATLLLSLMFFISELTYIRYWLLVPDDDEGSPNWLGLHIITALTALSSLMISLALIVGIVQKRHSLLVPWLVFNSLVFVCITAKVFYDSFSFHMDDMIFCFVIMCFGIIIIYPMYILYIEIHRQNMEIREEQHIKDRKLKGESV